MRSSTPRYVAGLPHLIASLALRCNWLAKLVSYLGGSQDRRGSARYDDSGRSAVFLAGCAILDLLEGETREARAGRFLVSVKEAGAGREWIVRRADSETHVHTRLFRVGLSARLDY